MYEKFFKKRLITVPVSHFYHTVISPTSALTMSSWAVLTQWRKANCLNRNSYKKMGKKITLEGFFSLFPSHSCNHFAFSLSLFTRSSIGRKIHTYDILKKKKYNDDKHRHEVQASSSAFFLTPPTPQTPLFTHVSISLCCRFLMFSAQVRLFCSILWVLKKKLMEG